MSVPNLLEVSPAGAGTYSVIKSPSEIKWGVYDISAADAGRTLDGVMHKERLQMPAGQKRKMELKWYAVKYGSDIVNGVLMGSADILQAFTPEYIDVKYPDPQTGSVETKTFYTGDKELTFRLWLDGRQIMTDLSFNIIEQ